MSLYYFFLYDELLVIIYYNDIIIKIFDDYSAVMELFDTKSSGTESESDL